MSLEPYPFWLKNPRKRRIPDRLKAPDPGGELKTIDSAPRRSRRPKQLDAGSFTADIGSFALHLAAEGKAPSTIRNYTEAVRWFAGEHLLRQTCKTGWEQVDTDDVRRWMVHLLESYSDVYADGQYRGLQQFFKWLAAEDDLPDPMERLRGPKVTEKMVPVFTSVELSLLAKACRGNTFADRRDAAVIAVFRATGIRLSELAGICYVPDNLSRTDLDLEGRQIRIRGKGGKGRIVKIGHEAARAVDRYLRVRGKHAEAYRPQLWLGVNNKGPLTPAGIYQAVARRGQQCGVAVYPHRFRHHFSHTWLERGGEGGDLMELNGWSSPQMLTRYGASARASRARRHYDHIMDDGLWTCP
ncbi:MAG TPA: tyrosine-type recombinase/integrase [Streptosporangiaceae bacterium]|jgi:integrase/recombinase XerD